MKKSRKNRIFNTGATVENPAQQKQKSAGFSTSPAYTKFDMRRHMASCVLSTSKHFQYLKITCPSRLMRMEKRSSEVARFWRKYSMKLCGFF